ncbi:PilZ domain-containing protein [Sphingomonas sp. dw_22]|uniref:PilZ domain-containing protein n=1 Tax=Sphingomonas sp. dw_22 TaxID=2721175 RepID=UPI001BD6C9D7|nr:PilZ domain-containing protein [Sphingomonas sp. dw_22]
MFQAVVELLPHGESAPVASWSERRASERLPADITANVRARGSGLRVKAEVVDLSVEGCRFLSWDYQVGDDVLIALAHLAPICGRVRWIKDGSVGVEFGSKLHPSVVKHLSSL